MMGASKYQTRFDLLKRKATGVAEEIEPAKQALFDRGHEAERVARPIVEAMIGEELFPATVTAEVFGLPLLASMDGITMMEEIIWETKLLNQPLKKAVEQGELDLHYAYQLEQSFLYLAPSSATSRPATEQKKARSVCGTFRFQICAPN
jgi:predicted phage-related endonuclease